MIDFVLTAYKNALENGTRAEIQEAYDDLLSAFADDADLPDDADFESGVDKMLNDMGIPLPGGSEREDVTASHEDNECC